MKKMLYCENCGKLNNLKSFCTRCFSNELEESLIFEANEIFVKTKVYKSKFKDFKVEPFYEKEWRRDLGFYQLAHNLKL